MNLNLNVNCVAFILKVELFLIGLNWIILFSLFEIKNIWKNVVKTCYVDLFIDGFVKFLELLQMFNKEL